MLPRSNSDTKEAGLVTIDSSVNLLFEFCFQVEIVPGLGSSAAPRQSKQSPTDAIEGTSPDCCARLVKRPRR